MTEETTLSTPKRGRAGSIALLLLVLLLGFVAWRGWAAWQARETRIQAASTDAGTTLVLTDGIEVRWGDATQATAKSDALQVLLEQADRPTIEGIDVSVPRAATLTRND